MNCNDGRGRRRRLREGAGFTFDPMLNDRIAGLAES